jgi:TfoX/Sxy family transcriptional regulator of competence genes
MATRQSTIDFLLEQTEAVGEVSAKKMFGEYGIFWDDKMVAMVCDGQLFVKPTVAGRELIGVPVEGSPYPGAKPCFLISGDRWEERAWLIRLLEVTAAELPAPKKKPVASKKR